VLVFFDVCLPVQKKVSLLVCTLTERFTHSVAVLTWYCPSGHTHAHTLQISFFFVYDVCEGNGICFTCIKVNEFPLLVDMIHDFFGYRKVSISDFLDKNDVIAMDDLKSPRKTQW